MTRKERVYWEKHCPWCNSEDISGIRFVGKEEIHTFICYQCHVISEIRKEGVLTNLADHKEAGKLRIWEIWPLHVRRLVSHL